MFSNYDNNTLAKNSIYQELFTLSSQNFTKPTKTSATSVATNTTQIKKSLERQKCRFNY